MTNNNRRATKTRRSDCKCHACVTANQAENIAARNFAVCRFVLPAILWSLFLSHDLVVSKPAFGANLEVTPITQVTIDAEGKPLRFPFHLFYDKIADETYVSFAGGAKVNVYAGDFFPLVSFASGRDIDHARGGFIDAQRGLIYICQYADEDKPARISVFNGAFILVREIYLDNIPKVTDFFPEQVVVSRDGLFYVVGQNLRGVMVLDNDGNFLRWLKPEDETYMSPAQVAALEGQESANDEAAENSDIQGSSPEQPATEKPEIDIPEQFRPRSKEEKEAESGLHIGPVQIQSINIDSAGRLYLLSLETSKTYVYNAEETFLFSFGAKGGTPRTLSNPRDEAIDEDRKLIYVVDYMRHTVVVYDQNDGKYLFEFGGKGHSLGWFNYPTAVAVNNRGQVMVADLFNHRVQVLEVKYQPDFPLSMPSRQDTASEGADRTGAAAQNEKLGSEPADGEAGGETTEGGAAVPNVSADKENTGAAPLLIETHGAAEEETIQDDGGGPKEIPAADDAVPPQNDPDEEKMGEGK
jgi:hypothetical protein